MLVEPLRRWHRQSVEPQVDLDTRIDRYRSLVGATISVGHHEDAFLLVDVVIVPRQHRNPTSGYRALALERG